MISRYEIFCRVIETGNFTRVAEELGYSQSAISQTIKALEQELDTVLVHRRKDGIFLTRDGMQFFPYIQSIYNAEKALARKQTEIQGLERSVITIGTFTGVSRVLLPKLMRDFKVKYPDVRFML